jgi:hypothetical protein
MRDGTARVTRMDGANTEMNGEHAPRTLWVLHKEGHSMTCLISGRPGHEELRVLFDCDLYFSEIHTVHDGLLGRARTLYHGFEAHGWTSVVAVWQARP